MSAIAPHQTLGSYVIERELGRGGMGAIYLGVHSSLGKRAAIKVLLPELSRRDDLIARFWAEARAVTAIKHASIVDVYDYGVTEDGRTFIVMEYLEGETLGARLKARGLLPIPQAITIARQIANALAAAHAVGVVHRDLKPDNIILVDDPEVAGGQRAKLLDFGVAKLVETEETAKTVTGALLGTPHYMSPEQCEGARAVDHRSDLYSLGCTLFQMVSGRLPFESAGIGGLIGMHLHVPPPKLRDRAGHASPALERIVARLLEKQPDARFSSGAELAAALSDPAASEVDAAASAPLPKQVVDAYLPTAVSLRPDAPENAATQPSVPVSTKGRTRWAWLAASVGLVGTLAVSFALSSRDGSNGPRLDQSTSAGLPGDDAGLRSREPDADDIPVVEPAAVPPIAAVARLLDAKRWIEAGLRASELTAFGMTSEDIAKILAPTATAAARDVEARITELSEDGECEAAATEAARFALGWGRIAQPATLIARGCGIDDDDTSAFYTGVVEAYVNGDAEGAARLCKLRKQFVRELRMTCAFIACAAQDPASKIWLGALKKPDADKVIAECQLVRESGSKN